METPPNEQEPPADRPAVASTGAQGSAGGAPAVAGGAGSFPIPLYRPVPSSPDSLSYDIGQEGTIRFAGGCITLHGAAGRKTIPIFPMGTRWEEVGERLVVQGTVVRSGDRISSGGDTAEREFWHASPAGHQDHVAVPDGCTAERYVRISGPVRVVR